MSHDLNLINTNYTGYLSPSAPSNHNQTHSQPFSLHPITLSSQNLYSFNSPHHNNISNYMKQLQKPNEQLNQAINQNHQALKSLIEMIDSRKTRSTGNGLSFNKTKQYQRSNRFKRRPSQEIKRDRRNFVEDLKEVKQKMNEIMSLIDIKIKVNQYQPENTYNLYDFDEIKQKLTFQSAKLDVLQKDNVDKNVSWLPKADDNNLSRPEFKGTTDWNELLRQTSFNQQKNNQTIDDQECLHLKHSFDKLNDVHLHQDTFLYKQSRFSSKQKDEHRPTITHNQLNENNIVEFFSSDRNQHTTLSVHPSPSTQNDTYKLQEIKQATQNDTYKLQEIKQANQTPPVVLHQPISEQAQLQPSRTIQISEPPSNRVVRFQKPMSLDTRPKITNHSPQIKVNYKHSQMNLKGSNASSRLVGHQSRFYNPNAFGRPLSSINQPPPQIINRIPMQIASRPPVSHFSPPPTHSPSLPFRSQQKAIVRDWDEDSRPELSFGLSSSVSTHRNGESGTNLKKSSKNSQKFSFIQHFANNPDARKKREESVIQTQQAKQSIVEYGLPKIITEQPTQKLKNPFQEWNQRQAISPNQRESQPIQINDNSMRTVLQTSGHQNKSIIHQTQFFQSSKSGSKPSNKLDLPESNQLVTASAYRKKKKGLEISQRMNQTHYYTKP